MTLKSLVSTALLGSLIVAMPAQAKLSSKERARLQADVRAQADIVKLRQELLRGYERAENAARGADLVVKQAAKTVPYGGHAYSAGKAAGKAAMKAAEKRKRK